MTQTARVYAGALYDLAGSEGLEDRILGDLALFSQLLRENGDYLRLLCTPSIPKKERCGLLDEALRESVHPYTLHFLKILCENGTMSQFSDCARQYRVRYNEAHGILEACAVSAVPMPEALAQRLKDKLERLTGKQVELTTRVDERLIGGVRLELPDRQLDGSVQTHLQQLKKQLRETTI